MQTISRKTAEQIHQIGRRYADHISVEAAWDAAIADGYNLDWRWWEHLALFGAGYKGREYHVRRYRRWGQPNIDESGYIERSYNHADNTPERGVSMATREWEATYTGLMMLAAGNRPVVRLWGVEVGCGGDGEPVIVPVSAPQR